MAGVSLNLCYMGKPPSSPTVKKCIKSPLMASSSTLSFEDRVGVSPVGAFQKYSSSLKAKGLRNMSSTTVCTSTPSADTLETSLADTPIPIYVMLPLGIITWNDLDKKSELVDGVTLKHQLYELKKRGVDGVMLGIITWNKVAEKTELVDGVILKDQLRKLKDCGVDGVMIDCWWGLVERDAEAYHWEGYSQLFELVKSEGLKLQVVMSFHSCGGNVGDDVNIPLPKWVCDIGDNKKINANIYFMDEQGRVNKECLSWGIDDKAVLDGRTAIKVYSDYMHSFRREFSTFFEDGTISEVEVGLGPCGELRYPSYPEIHGWRYPGIGQFQCYDAYLKESLDSAAESLGKSNWKNPPKNMGTYNSTPQETGFFCKGGDYDSFHGRFFLSWYAGILIRHGDLVLSAAKHIFKGTPVAAKLAGVHWWYDTNSHAAEVMAGFYNIDNRDGYTSIIAMLKKHEVALNFTCVELRTVDQQFSFPDAMTDPERLVWQVLNNAWDQGIKVAAENALPCYTREGYEKILEIARPRDSPDGRQLCGLTYLRLSHVLLEHHHIEEFRAFVDKLHGK